MNNKSQWMPACAFLVHAVSLFFTTESWAQGSPARSAPEVKVLPPTPEAAAFSKYGNVPVGTFTGIPAIAIPLYSMQVKGYTLPISLNYHASGVKVEEVSSNVGIGWTLSAGGVVSTTINNIADNEPNYGYKQGAVGLKNMFDTGAFLPYTQDPHQGNKFDPAYIALHDLDAGGLDGDPDVYNFSCGGRSGMFVLDEQAVARPIPYQPLKIDANYLNKGYRITDENGVQFIYTTMETGHIGQARGSNCNAINWFYAISDYHPTFYLTTVLTPLGDRIEFTYETLSYSYLANGSQTKFDFLSTSSATQCDPLPTKNCQSIISVIDGKRIKRITSSTGDVVSFSYGSASRVDLPGTNSIDGVTVSHNNTVLKEWVLSHAYFQANNSSPSSPENFRLKLTSVKEGSNPPYLFSYNNFLPSTASSSQDYWGYYNAANNADLIPSATLDNGTYYEGANREVNPAAAQAGVLQKITYPTGGSTEFQYESNEYHFTGTERTFTPSALTELKLFEEIAQKTVTFTTGAGITNPTNPTTALEATIEFRTNLPPNLPPGDVILGQLTGNGVTENFENTSVMRSVSLRPNSTYTLKLSSTVDYFSGPAGFVPVSGQINVKWFEPSQQAIARNIKSGGLRIKKTIDQAQLGGEQTVKEYLYSALNDANKSSGYCINEPINSYYHLYQNVSVTPGGDGGPSSYYNGLCQYLARSSSSTATLSTVNGNSVGYEYVTLLDGTAGANGKTVYHYSKYDDVGSYTEPIKGIVSLSTPYTAKKSTSYDWLRGLLLDRTEYKASDAGYKKISREVNQYHIEVDATAPNQKSVLGLKSVLIKPELLGIPPTLLTGQYVLFAHHYVSNWFYLKKTERILYDGDDETKASVTVTSYEHANPAHTLITGETTTTSSTGVSRKLTLTYPLDYSVGTGTDVATLAIKELQAQHILTPTIEKRVSRVSASNTAVISSQVNTYKASGNFVLPSAALSLSTPIPLALSPTGTSAGHYVPAHISSTGHFVADGKMQTDVLYDAYDASNNLTTYKRPSGTETSIIWGYANTRPIAEVKNAALNQIAYTGFEAESPGGWSYASQNSQGSALVRADAAVYGESGYRLIGTGGVSRSNVPPGDYEISFWAKGGRSNVVLSVDEELSWSQGPLNNKGFQLVRAKVRVSNGSANNPTGIIGIDAHGREVDIDDLRLQPEGAQMTTYNHKPFVGVTAISDPAGRTITYEYDEMGRLVRTRDEQGRILSQQQYHYAGQ